jgi:hypothetical protein
MDVKDDYVLHHQLLYTFIALLVKISPASGGIWSVQ